MVPLLETFRPRALASLPIPPEQRSLYQKLRIIL